FEQKGIKSETHLLIRGIAPGEDVVRFAKEKGVDEIIYGMRKESKVAKIVFGSNAQYIILEAHCPVVIVK
ncbi:MAG: universal stress protein, partial [Desulfamplus sp.]|nr:universal stress protein [Desulfamplus sp.]